MRTVWLLGLEFADMDAAEAARLLAERPGWAPFGYVVTPNADHLVRLHRQRELVPLYRAARLRLLDSRVVARAARLFVLNAPHVAPGSDLTSLLLSQHLTPGERITIIGLRSRYLPALMSRAHLTAVAHYDPPLGFELDPAAMQKAVEFVLAHPARFIFLAVGSPRQEMLAAAILASGQACGTGLCIGASLEFVAGHVPRAPPWMQRAGLEWLHRLARDPPRLARRYLVDCPAVFPLLLREFLRIRRLHRVAATKASSRSN